MLNTNSPDCTSFGWFICFGGAPFVRTIKWDETGGTTHADHDLDHQIRIDRDLDDIIRRDHDLENLIRTEHDIDNIIRTDHDRDHLYKILQLPL